MLALLVFITKASDMSAYKYTHGLLYKYFAIKTERVIPKTSLRSGVTQAGAMIQVKTEADVKQSSSCSS